MRSARPDYARPLDERLVPRFTEPLPPHDDASLDLVEATVWRLLAGRSLRRAGQDVTWLVALVQRYAEAYAARLQRDGVSSAARLTVPSANGRPREEVSHLAAEAGCESLREGVEPPGSGEQSPTAAEVREASSRLNAALAAGGEPVNGTSKRCRDCHEVKGLDEFYQSRTNRDGRKGTCKSCLAEQRRAVNAIRTRARLTGRGE